MIEFKVETSASKKGQNDHFRGPERANVFDPKDGRCSDGGSEDVGFVIRKMLDHLKALEMECGHSPPTPRDSLHPPHASKGSISVLMV